MNAQLDIGQTHPLHTYHCGMSERSAAHSCTPHSLHSSATKCPKTCALTCSLHNPHHHQHTTANFRPLPLTHHFPLTVIRWIESSLPSALLREKARSRARWASPSHGRTLVQQMNSTFRNKLLNAMAVVGGYQVVTLRQRESGALSWELRGATTGLRVM